MTVFYAKQQHLCLFFFHHTGWKTRTIIILWYNDIKATSHKRGCWWTECHHWCDANCSTAGPDLPLMSKKTTFRLGSEIEKKTTLLSIAKQWIFVFNLTQRCTQNTTNIAGDNWTADLYFARSCQIRLDYPSIIAPTCSSNHMEIWNE